MGVLPLKGVCHPFVLVAVLVFVWLVVFSSCMHIHIIYISIFNIKYKYDMILLLLYS